MYLFRKVGNRATGMGLKVSKFHSIVHMADDILNFGVPMEFDTGANKSGHKATKKAAKLTQRYEATFVVKPLNGSMKCTYWKWQNKNWREM